MFRSAAVLDADLSVRDTLKRLALYGDRDPAVIRSQTGLSLSWFVRAVGDIRATLTGEPPDTILKEALHLEDAQAADTLQLADAPRQVIDEFDGVILDGSRVIGVSRGLPYALAVGAAEEAEEPEDEDIALPRDLDFRRHRRRSAPVAAAPDPNGGRGIDEERGADAEPEAAPSEVYPRLEAPDRVEPAERFDFTVGLSSARVAGVVGGPLDLPDVPPGDTVQIDVQVYADGFEAPSGWCHVLLADPARPDVASLTIPLIAPEIAEDARPAFLMVHFAVGGNPVGMAQRPIMIARPDADVSADMVTAWSASAFGAGDDASLNLSVPDSPADLTIRIVKADANDASGRFDLSFVSPHTLPPLAPDADATISLGTDASSFARALISAVRGAEGTALLDNQLESYGRVIAGELPDAFWSALRAVWDAVQAERRIPTLLLLSAETNIPWELAWLDDPFLPDRPHFLGAQLHVGRWIIARPGKPAAPPPATIEVSDMAVVVGDYASASGQRKLPHAEEEGKILADEYSAQQLTAEVEDIDRLLGGDLDPVPQAIHFACHGVADPEHPEYSAIILGDGSRLSPILFNSARVEEGRGPFLFLNACQVGNGGEFLGDYGGFAAVSLARGFRGFLAPLWDVEDDIAHEIAVEFYRRALGKGDTPAETVSEILWDLRGRFAPDSDGKIHSTYLAYMFFGHPSLLLERAGE